MEMPPTLVLPARHHNSPRTRAEIKDLFNHFHSYHLSQKGREKLLDAYCQSLKKWVENPNTDLYHIEMLFDEISLALQDADPAAQAEPV